MGLLDDLKNQAKEHSNLGKGNQPKQFGNIEQNRIIALDKIKKIRTFLQEIVEQINIIRPTISYDYSIPNLGCAFTVNLKDIRITSEINDQIETILLKCFLQFDPKSTINIEKIEDLDHQIELLETHDIKLKTTHAGHGHAPQLTLLEPIPVVFSFEPDYLTPVIRLCFRNAFKPGVNEFSIDVDTIEDTFLEEFGKYVLNRENSFTENYLPKELTDSDASSGDNETSTLSATLEIQSEHLHALLKRKLNLYLSYNNEIKELSSEITGFTIGRGKRCNMSIRTDVASREHLKIEYRNGKFILIDQSTNGTFVKIQGGKEVFLHGEELPFSGSGLISLGKPITVGTENLIYYTCQ